MSAPQRIKFGPVPVDCVTREQALDRIEQLVAAREGGTVFTPNVDHVVLADESDAFRAAYARASLSLADGMPLVWSSRLLGTRLPERVAGSRPGVSAARARRGAWVARVLLWRRRRRGREGARRSARIPAVAPRRGRRGSCGAARRVPRGSRGGAPSSGRREAGPRAGGPRSAEAGAVDRAGANGPASRGSRGGRSVARLPRGRHSARP